MHVLFLHDCCNKLPEIQGPKAMNYYFYNSVVRSLTCPTGMCAKSLQSCPTLCDPLDHSLSGSPVHGILQARILGWVAISSSRGSS